MKKPDIDWPKYRQALKESNTQTIIECMQVFEEMVRFSKIELQVRGIEVKENGPNDILLEDGR